MTIHPVKIHYSAEGSRVEHLPPRYEGATLEVGWKTERYGWDDYESARYARCWDAAAGEVVTVGMGWRGSDEAEHTRAYVDATQEAIEAAGIWLADQNRLKNERDRAEQEARDELAAAAAAFEPTQDAVVVVCRGAKVPWGSVGRVFWLKSQPAYQYGPRWRNSAPVPMTLRLGVALSERLDARGRSADAAFLDAANVAVVPPSCASYVAVGSVCPWAAAAAFYITRANVGDACARLAAWDDLAADPARRDAIDAFEAEHEAAVVAWDAPREKGKRRAKNLKKPLTNAQYNATLRALVLGARDLHPPAAASATPAASTPTPDAAPAYAF